MGKQLLNPVVDVTQAGQKRHIFEMWRIQRNTCMQQESIWDLSLHDLCPMSAFRARTGNNVVAHPVCSKVESEIWTSRWWWECSISGFHTQHQDLFFNNFQLSIFHNYDVPGL